jgi:two-component SAPR family response regulator
MPGMTGIELIEKIRREQAGMRVILVTGYTELSARPNDIPKLDKPFDQASLAHANYAVVAANIVPFRGVAGSRAVGAPASRDHAP